MGKVKIFLYSLGILLLISLAYYATSPTLFSGPLISSNIGNFVFNKSLSSSRSGLNCVSEAFLSFAGINESCSIYHAYYNIPGGNRLVSVFIVEAEKNYGDKFFTDLQSGIKTGNIVRKRSSSGDYLFQGSSLMNNYYWHSGRDFVTVNSPLPDSYNQILVSDYLRKYIPDNGSQTSVDYGTLLHGG